MDLPLEITFHGLDHSDAVEARLREKFARLERQFSHIVSARIVVGAPHTVGQQGPNLYQVSIHLAVPGRTIDVDRGHHNSSSHADLQVAIRDAFQAAEKQLESYATQMKSHRG